MPKLKRIYSATVQQTPEIVMYTDANDMVCLKVVLGDKHIDLAFLDDSGVLQLAYVDDEHQELLKDYIKFSGPFMKTEA
jgi:hypothetical protein